MDLVSLGTLDKQGYVFHNGDEQLKIRKGDLAMKKGKLQHGIYILMSSYSFMGTMIVSCTKKNRNDNIELWHFRLDHMSGSLL